MASAVICSATIKSCCSVTPPIVIGTDTVPSTLIGTPSTPTSLWVTIGFSPALVGFILVTPQLLCQLRMTQGYCKYDTTTNNLRHYLLKMLVVCSVQQDS